jgi:hypothetical protein
VTALAHQFAGLICPLHGSISADNLPLKLTICLINEVSPLTLAGPNWAIFRPKKKPPRSDRAIADNWRGLYGSDRFSSIRPLATFEAVFWTAKPRNSTEYINVSGVFA